MIASMNTIPVLRIWNLPLEFACVIRKSIDELLVVERRT